MHIENHRDKSGYDEKSGICYRRCLCSSTSFGRIISVLLSLLSISLGEVWNKVYKSDNSFFGEEPSNFALLCFNHMKTNNVKKVLELGANMIILQNNWRVQYSNYSYYVYAMYARH
jgi:hypothetical protein